MTEVRTRFAPSPTGLQHIGGFRTAFYSWLLAKHFGGKFLLRIEDTDQERLVPGAIKYILQEFKWLGIEIDEGPSHEELKAINEYWEGAPNIGGPCGPYIQSLRLKRYKEIAEELIAKGAAYRCDCTPQMLEKERLEQQARKESPGYSGYCRTREVPADAKHVVRFKMPHKPSLQYTDAVKGLVSWENIPLKDPVLLKSDGFPTYHLAVVVDDHDMRISHLMRSDEWLSSAPLHLMLYQALGWTAPVFCHLPAVLGPDGKKLSKRHGASSLDVFRDQGYLPEALLNYVCLVGWSPGEGNEQEVFDRDGLIKAFSLQHVNKASAVFDYSKLAWMNGVYIRNLTVDGFLSRIAPFMEKEGVSVSAEKLRFISPMLQERVKTLAEVPAMLQFLAENKKDKIDRDMAAMLSKDIDAAKARKILEDGKRRISEVADFTHTVLEAALRPLATEMGVKAGPLFMVFRIAVTGKKITPPLFESMVALGKEKVLQRIEETIELVSKV